MIVRRLFFGFMTTAQKEFFNRNGYTLLRKFLTPAQCHQAIARIDEIIEEKVKTEERSKMFSDVSTKELQDSATTVELFYQSNSFKDGKFVRDKKSCINKIGHNLHELDPLFKELTYSKKAVEVLKTLEYVRPVVTQSMAILKVPHDG